jgi:hypothetical protein
VILGSLLQCEVVFRKKNRSKDVCDQETDGEASVLRAETHRFRQEHKSGKSASNPSMLVFAMLIGIFRVISAHWGCGVAHRGVA